MWIDKTYFLCILIDNVWIGWPWIPNICVERNRMVYICCVYLFYLLRSNKAWYLRITQTVIYFFSEWPRGMLNLQIVDEIFVTEPLVQPE